MRDAYAEAFADGEVDDDALREQYEQAEANGDQGGMAIAMYRLGTLQLNRGDNTDAQEKFGAALALSREIGDRRGEAASLCNIGAAALQNGELAVARDLLEEALSVQQEIGDSHGEAASLHELAVIATRQGDVERARQLYLDSLGMRRNMNDRAGEAITLSNLGALAVQRGRPDAALALMVLGYGLNAAVQAPGSDHLLASAQQLASDLGYTESGLDELVNRVLSAYREDGGASLIEEAFS